MRWCVACLPHLTGAHVRWCGLKSKAECKPADINHACSCNVHFVVSVLFFDIFFAPVAIFVQHIALLGMGV